jgi:hypothetical protein
VLDIGVVRFHCQNHLFGIGTSANLVNAAGPWLSVRRTRFSRWHRCYWRRC